jgi:pyruvate dehydrogenase E2 component (dihydrolipoamide acetyltransferase)
MPEPAGRDFLLPDLGEGLEDATIVQWLVAPGDVVALNQPLCVVETAKTELEVPSPYAGTIVALGGDDGETLPVGALLARIDTVVDLRAATRPEPTLVGYGHDEAIDRSRRSRHRRPTEALGAVASGPGTIGGAGRPRAKPPIRLLARRLGVDLRTIAPTGPGGVVTQADVERAAALSTEAPSPGADDDVSIIPVRGVRARVAAHMTESRQTIPDASCRLTADFTRLLDVRAALNAHAERRGLEAVITPFALLCRLVVQTLQANPILNSSYDADAPAIRVHNHVRLGIATATDRGLVVTVVHDADHLGVHALATEMARLATGARETALAPHALQGSTFTISNLGALGLDDGVPIINAPEAAILGVGSIRRRPHVVDDEVVARDTASLTLVFDHRVCDGAEAGAFVTGLRELIEAPELALFGS